MDTERIVEIVNHHAGEQGALISILEDVQTAYGYLPAEALRTVAERTGRHLVDVYGVATFYKAFSLKPRGKHVCTVCVGTACHVRGAPSIVEEFQANLGVEAGETTPDREFSLLTVNCLGACALGPIVVLDGQYFSNVSTTKVPQVIEQGRLGVCAEDLTRDERVFPIEVACPRCNHTLMDQGHPIAGHPSIRVAMSAGGRTSWLYLSGLYGLTAWEASNGAGAGEMVRLYCPFCQGALGGVSPCPECDAPLVPLLVRQGAILQVCSRLGCRGRALDLSGVNA